MKTLNTSIIRSALLFTLFLFIRNSSSAQGRVVINEFMAWSGCNTTSEYIELMNFGPGPMDIGCYIVTNGQYAVTIPPNTILNAGEYYVLSGQNTLPIDCGNIDSAITVDLNWNTCNCADKPIPTTGNGFMADGGGANEKVVLFSPALVLMDAVSRALPASSSVAITTASNSGSCTQFTFDLDTMSLNYETINIATGIDNSYSRRVDGDCGWVKTTDISANAPNKTGSTASATYSFTTLTASECNGSTGSISIGVSAPDVASLFPMTYTIAYDKDSNNVFDNNDIYIQGTDNTSPSIDIDNLAYGRYRITVGSSSGCNLQSFDFFIFNCYGVLLPFREDNRLGGVRNTAGVYDNIQLWPNPANGDIFVRMMDGHSRFTYTIVNMSGAVVYKGRFTTSISNNTVQLSTAHLKQGVYQLLIYDEKTYGCRSLRFIMKQK